MFSKRKKTIFKSIFVPIMFIMIIQSVLYYIVAVYGGILDTLKKNAEEILEERVINRKNEIETSFNTYWTNMSMYTGIIDDIYESYTNKGSKPFYGDDIVQKSFLNDTSSILIEMLRSNKVNGVFIILNDQKEYSDISNGGEQYKYGLCIRDYDIVSTYTDNDDLLVVRCPSSMINTVGCSLETWWDGMYTFNNEKASDYYYKPLKAAYDNPGVDNDNLAYFSGIHNFERNDKQVVSYSLPLIDNTGYPYGVIGIELTTDYLRTLLPSKELYGQNVGSYCLVEYTQENVEDVATQVNNGILYKRSFGESPSLKLDYIEGSELFKSEGANDISLVGVKKDINIYNRNTPFEDTHLALIGMVESNNLYSVCTTVKNLLLILSIVTLVIDAICILIVSRRFAAPITKLSRKVKETSLDTEYNLEKLNIIEIDQLITSIEVMSKGISENQARTEFFSRMSHDMRTPMNAIIGFSSEEILENASEAEKDEYLSKIHCSGKYLLGLINEILDITKINSGKMELHIDNISLKEVFDDIIPIIQEVAEQKNIQFITEFVNDLDCNIYGDIQRLKQIFMNLLSNAIKFTNDGGLVKLRAIAMNMDNKTITYKITITDNGIGMNEDFLRKMYTPFQQEATGREGTGLGLAIVKKLVDLMDANIQCNSYKDEGTEFIVTLNCQIAERMDNDKTADTSAEKLNSPTDNNTDDISNKTNDNKEDLPKADELEAILSGKHILLCEDHPMNQQIAYQLLTKKGLVVDIADNGQIGVERFNESAIGYYDAILMDIRMPVMNGLDATKSIRALDRDDAAKVPIIAMTANAFQTDVDDFLNSGMNQHLSKPFQPMHVYQVIAKWINQYDKS